MGSFRLRVGDWRVLVAELELKMRQDDPIEELAAKIATLQKQLIAQNDRIADLEDAISIAAAKKAVESGEDELIPAEVVNRIIDGENPIRVYRDYRGLTQKDLAQKVDISGPYLCELSPP